MKESVIKSINGFDGKYGITYLGEVVNLSSGKVLKGTLDKNGYVKITLTITRNKQLTRRRARLVAEAWLDNPLNLPTVNHKDGNKINDAVENLEWATARENTIHAWTSGLCKPYDRAKPYNRQAIVESNKRRKKVVDNSVDNLKRVGYNIPTQLELFSDDYLGR